MMDDERNESGRLNHGSVLEPSSPNKAENSNQSCARKHWSFITMMRVSQSRERVVVKMDPHVMAQGGKLQQPRIHGDSGHDQC